MRVEATPVGAETAGAVDEAVVEAGDVVADHRILPHVVEKSGQDVGDGGAVGHLLETDVVHLGGGRGDVAAFGADEATEALVGRALVVITGGGKLDDLVATGMGAGGLDIVDDKDAFVQRFIADEKGLGQTPGRQGEAHRPIAAANAEDGLRQVGGGVAQGDDDGGGRQGGGSEFVECQGARLRIQIAQQGMVEDGGGGVAVESGGVDDEDRAILGDGGRQRLRLGAIVGEGDQVFDLAAVVPAPGRPQLFQ